MELHTDRDSRQPSVHCSGQGARLLQITRSLHLNEVIYLKLDYHIILGFLFIVKERPLAGYIELLCRVIRHANCLNDMITHYLIAGSLGVVERFCYTQNRHGSAIWGFHVSSKCYRPMYFYAIIKGQLPGDIPYLSSSTHSYGSTF